MTYGYDADGNRIQVGSQTFTYDARDELLSGAGSTYAYTPRGTLSSVTTGGTTTTSTFDAFNELIRQGSQNYSYDALSRVLTGNSAEFAYSGMSDNIAADGTDFYSRDPNGNLIGVAVDTGNTGQRSISALVMTDQHSDVVGEFGVSGTALTGSTTYDPLGNVLATSGQIGNLGYQSGWTDPFTANVSMGSRWYDPATGQFISRDIAHASPMPNSVASNAFAYGNDNPLTITDPLGTCGGFFCALTTVVNAVGNAVHTVAAAVGNAVSNAGSTLSSYAVGFSNFLAQTGAALARAAASAEHALAATAVGRAIQDGLNVVRTTISKAVNYVSHTAVGTAIAATYHAVKYAATAATQYVQQHAASIVSFVASTAVFMGCEAGVSALTAGAASLPGEVGCSALAGAVGNSVTYAMTTPMSKWSLAGFASTALQGALTGAAGGLLGPLGSKLLGPVVDAVASRLGPALVDDAADAVADVADSVVDDAGDEATSASSEAAASDASTPADSSPESSPDSAESAPNAENAGPSGSENSPAADSPSDDAPQEEPGDTLLAKKPLPAPKSPRLPMTMAKVQEVADKYGLDISKLTIKINKAMSGYYGSTAPDMTITLVRDAFNSEKELAITLAHESYHVDQLLAGMPYPRTYNAGSAWEQEAEDFAQRWWQGVNKP